MTRDELDADLKRQEDANARVLIALGYRPRVHVKAWRVDNEDMPTFDVVWKRAHKIVLQRIRAGEPEPWRCRYREVSP